MTTPPDTCTCGYDLKIRCHCGTCGKLYTRCLDCHLPTIANGCQCTGQIQIHPDYPEEWS